MALRHTVSKNLASWKGESLALRISQNRPHRHNLATALFARLENKNERGNTRYRQTCRSTLRLQFP